MAAAGGQHSSQEQSANSAKALPKDAIVMAAILKEMGVTQYEPRVINQMLEFTYRYVTDVLEDARVYSLHADKKLIDLDDVQLSVEARLDHSFTRPPPREFLLDIARKKNSQPLPLIPDKSGVRLPPDRYCLTANNYKLKPSATPHRRLSTSVPKPQLPKSHASKVQGGRLSFTAPHVAATDVKAALPLQAVDVKRPITLKTSAVSAAPANTQATVRPSGVPANQRQSTSTISNLPSMEETTASASAQNQEFPNLLKRKRDDDDDEDYDI